MTEGRRSRWRRQRAGCAALGCAVAAHLAACRSEPRAAAPTPAATLAAAPQADPQPAPAAPQPAAPEPAPAATAGAEVVIEASCPVDHAVPSGGRRPFVSRSWHTGAEGYARAEREQADTGAPLLVYFYTDWCPYCRRLDDTLLASARVDGFLGERAVKVRVNPESGAAERALAQRYGIGGYPSLFLVAPAGTREPFSPYGGRGRDGRAELLEPERFVASFEEEVGRRAASLVYEAYRLRQAGTLPRALELLDQALALEPDRRDALRERAVTRALAGATADALSDLRRLRDLDPSEVNLYEAVEFALGREQRWAEAAACWTQLIDRAPGSGRAWFRRGASLLRAGARARALADAEKACSLGEAEACEIVRSEKR